MPARSLCTRALALLLASHLLVGGLPGHAAPPTQINNVLPAALYYIGPDSQIHRLEADANSPAQTITDVLPVDSFDLAPTSGALVYVAGNHLVIADAHGREPRIIFEGGPLAMDEFGYPTFEAERSNVVRSPRWSPDGTQIAFALGGAIHVMATDGGEPQLVLPAGNPEPDAAPEFPIGSRLYAPIAWSPDGSQLAIRATYFPEGTGLALLDLAEPDPLPSEYLLCCGAAHWTQDGAALYFSSAAYVFGVSGLWRVNPASEAPQVIIRGSLPESPSTANLIAEARQLSDGKLYFFFGQFDFNDPENGHALRMFRADSDGVELEPLRNDSFVSVSEALWAPDGSGAVIMADQLLWLDTGDAPALALAASGRNLRWGIE